MVPLMDEQILALERLMADVIDFDGVSTQLLGPLQRLCSASDNLLFAFPVGASPAVLGGSLEEVMRTYSDDLFQEDLIQKYCYSLPAATYSTGDLRGFDVQAFRRSRPYVDFYRPNRIGFIRGIWPTGHGYGRPGMFGLFLCKPTLDPFDSSVDRSLRHLEQPFRAMARRIVRFGAAREERDALGRLLDHQRGAYVLWDRDGRAVWRSSEARAHLEQPDLFAELESAASEARLQAHELDTVPLRRSLLGRPQRLRSSNGAGVVATFLVDLRVRRPVARCRARVAAELGGGSGAHPAEMRVLRCLGRGLSNKEISAELSISHETAKTHVVRILRKLGVDSRAKAATWIRDAQAEIRLPRAEDLFRRRTSFEGRIWLGVRVTSRARPMPRTGTSARRQRPRSQPEPRRALTQGDGWPPPSCPTSARLRRVRLRSGSACASLSRNSGSLEPTGGRAARLPREAATAASSRHELLSQLDLTPRHGHRPQLHGQRAPSRALLRAQDRPSARSAVRATASTPPSATLRRISTQSA